MPSRWLCIAILGFWLFSMGWMFNRDWLPWLTATDEAPPFVFELADEVITQYTTWSLLRNDKKIGSARTTLRYLRNNTFEWVQTLSNLEVNASLGAFQVKALLPKVTTIMFVTPKGDLQSFDTTAELKVNLGGVDLKADLHLYGEVDGNQIQGTCELKSALGELVQPFGPSPIQSKNVFSPLQPVFRIKGLFPGRRWKINDFNPVSEEFRIALKSLLDNALKLKPGEKGFSLPLPEGATTELLAEVLSETQELDMKERVRKCYIIEYRSENVVARTWVDVEDGTVWRQEAVNSGEKLILQRD